MNEGVEAIELTQTRKKRRRSCFRFSSRKALNRSRVQREAAKVGGYQFESVTKALSFEECEIVHNVCEVGSSYLPCLDRVLEHDGVGKDLSIGNAIIYEDWNQKVSYFSFQFVVDNWHVMRLLLLAWKNNDITMQAWDLR